MLKELKKCLKTERKNKKIFDIVLYGSVVKGKRRPGDIDLLVIFAEGTLKERLTHLQLIKKKIKLKNVDLKGILLNELFQEVFFARTGIFLEGMSVFEGTPFSQKIGFSGFSLFKYSLKDKTHTEKVKFNYVLSGRGSAGMVEKLSGNHLAPGVVKIPIKNSLEFEEVLQRHSVNYRKEQILVESKV